MWRTLLPARQPTCSRFQHNTQRDAFHIRPALVLLLTRIPAWVYRRPQIARFQHLHCPDGRVLRSLGSRRRGAWLGDRTCSRNTSSSRGSRRRRTARLSVRHARPERTILFGRCLVAQNAGHDGAHQAKDESNDGHGKGRTRGVVDGGVVVGVGG